MITATINALNPWKKWRIAEKELMRYGEKLNELTELSNMNEFKNVPGISQAEYLFSYNHNNIKNDTNYYGVIADFIRLKNREILDIKNTLWSILFFGAINIVLLYIIPVLGIIVLISNIIIAAPIFKQLYEQHKNVSGFNKDKINEYLNEGIKQVMGLTIHMTLPEDAENAKRANQIIERQLTSNNDILKIIGPSSDINEINQKIIKRQIPFLSQKAIKSSISIENIKKINKDIFTKAEFNIVNNAVNEAIGCKDNIDSYEHIINKISFFIHKIENHKDFVEGDKVIKNKLRDDNTCGDKKEMIYGYSYINSLDSRSLTDNKDDEVTLVPINGADQKVKYRQDC